MAADVVFVGAGVSDADLVDVWPMLSASKVGLVIRRGGWRMKDNEARRSGYEPGHRVAGPVLAVLFLGCVVGSVAIALAKLAGVL